MDTSKQQSENRVVDANGKFAKGNHSGGRPKGSKNRLTVTVKELILGNWSAWDPITCISGRWRPRPTFTRSRLG